MSNKIYVPIAVNTKKAVKVMDKGSKKVPTNQLESTRPGRRNLAGAG